MSKSKWKSARTCNIIINLRPSGAHASTSCMLLLIVDWECMFHMLLSFVLHNSCVYLKVSPRASVEGSHGKLSKATPNKEKQSKPKPSKATHHRATNSRAKVSWANRSKAEQSKAEQRKAQQSNTEQTKPRAAKQNKAIGRKAKLRKPNRSNAHVS